MDRSKDFWVGNLFKIGFYAVHDPCCAVASSLDFYVGKKRHVNFSVALFRCCIGSILGRKTSQNWIGAFQDSCCPVASFPEI